MKAYDLQIALQNRDRVSELYIHNRGLKEFPAVILEFGQLKRLELTSNRLQQIPPDIFRLKNLQTLNLSGNRIEKLPVELIRLKKLLELSLAENRFEDIPDSVFNLESLRRLNFSNNQLGRIDPKLAKLRLLKTLDFSGNGIRRIPVAIAALKNLRQLYLQNNEIGSLPKTLFDCRELNWLDFSCNRIKVIPEWISNLNRLEKLIFSQNRIKRLPDCIAECTALTTVDGSNNKIEVLPGGFGRLSALRECNFAKNKLREFPENLEKLSSLKKLDLSENKLGSLPGAFISLTGLRSLNIRRNELDRLPDGILQHPGLKELDVRNNPLRLEPEQLLNLEKLENLPGRIGFDARTKKRLLAFLHRCREQEVPAHLRLPFFKLLNGTGRVFSRPVLLSALTFRNENITSQAKDHLIKAYTEKEVLSEDSVLVILGTASAVVRDIVPALERTGVRIAQGLSDEVTHILFGKNPIFKPSDIPEPVTFLDFKELKDFISSKQTNPLSRVEIETLGKLLTSNRPQNLELTLQIIKGRTIPEALLTDCFLAYKFALPGRQKSAFRAVFAFNFSKARNQLLRLPLGIKGNLSDKQLKTNLEKLHLAGFDVDKILRALSEYKKAR